MSSRVSVLVPATSVELVALADLKTALGISTNGDDARLEALIAQASAVIAQSCNRVFGREQIKQTIRLAASVQIPEPAPLVLSRRPVVVSGFTVSVSGVALDSGDYELDENAGLVWRLDSEGDRIPWPTNKIEVTYSSGYLLPDDCPASLSRACIVLVNNYRTATARDPMLKSEVVDGVGRFDYWVGSAGGSSQSGLPAEVESLIAPFRKVSF